MSPLDKKLPTEKKAKILTMGDDWMPLVVDAMLDGKTCVLPVGCGAYILAGAVTNKRGKKVAELINLQKGRDKDRPIAFDMPPDEISYWVDEKYQTEISTLVKKLISRPFGIIAPINDKVPLWQRVKDQVHGVYNDLFVWADMDNIGPLADFYRYVREKRKLSKEDFILIATSGNLTGFPNNNKFSVAYDQLGNKEGIAYAVYDPDEGGPYSLDPVTIISVMPLIRGREKLHVFRLGSMSVEDLLKLVPEAEKKSKLGMTLYKLNARLDTMGKRFLKR